MTAAAYVFTHSADGLRPSRSDWLKPKKTIIEHDIKENIKMKEETVVPVVTDPIPASYIGVSELELNMTGPKHVILGMLETVLSDKCEYGIKLNLFKVRR